MLKGSKEIFEEIMRLVKVCDYENAQELIEIYLKREGENAEILDIYAEVLTNLNCREEAMMVLEKSIKLDPDSNGDKYMSLAELSDHKVAQKLFLKGIEIYKKKLENEVIIEEIQELKISIANGYSALAELYMNTPLCNNKNAETNVEKFLTTALSFDPNNFDALLQFSNLRILRRRDTEALEFMDRIYSAIKECLLQNMENYPSLEIVFQLAKNYLELECYTKTIYLLDLLIKFDDENLEYWYLLSFSHFKIKNYKHSMKCLKNLFKMKFKLKDDDKEIEVASNELLNELNKLGELTNNTYLNDEIPNTNKEECCEEESGSTGEMNID